MTHVLFGITVVLAIVSFIAGVLLLMLRRVRLASISVGTGLSLAGAALAVIGFVAPGLAAKSFFWTGALQLVGIGVGIAWKSRSPKKSRKFKSV